MPKPRQTDAQHIAKGTFQPSRHGDPAKKLKLKNVAVVPRAPVGLGAVGRRAWRKYAKVLIDACAFTEGDFAILRSFCQADEALVAEWSVPVAAQHRMLACELGLTPVSRSKIPAEPAGNPKRTGPRAI